MEKKTKQEDTQLCVWRCATLLCGWVYRRVLWWLEGDGMTVWTGRGKGFERVCPIED